MCKIFIILILATSISTIFPQNDNSRRGLDYYHSENYREALRFFLKAYKSDEKGNYNLPLEMGNCYRLLGNYKESLKWLNDALKNQKEGYEARIYYLMGDCYKKLKRDNEADKYFKFAEENGIPYPPEYKFEKDGWFFLVQSGSDYIYYQKKSLKKLKYLQLLEFGLNRYQTKNSISDEDIKRMYDQGISQEKLSELKLNERKGIKYSIQLEEYNCHERKSRFLSISEYDSKDR